MSNRSRKERARTRRPHSKISAGERIRTVELYLRFKNTNRVAEELGLCGATVRDRLYVAGVPLRPQGFSSVGADWEQQVRARLTELRRAAEKTSNDAGKEPKR